MIRPTTFGARQQEQQAPIHATPRTLHTERVITTGSSEMLKRTSKLIAEFTVVLVIICFLVIPGNVVEITVTSTRMSSNLLALVPQLHPLCSAEASGQQAPAPNM